MTDPAVPAPATRNALYEELQRVVTLRWIAGGVILAGALLNGLWLQWYDRWPYLAVIGLLILAYNTGLRMVMSERLKQRGQTLLLFTWVQLLLDLACLTILAMLTGGLRSPVALFYVFHMVFASLLLPRTMAYGAAIAAVAMLVGGLWLTDRLQGNELLVAGHTVALGFTVFLANRIVERLRAQSRHLRRQNRRIRRISRRLRRHQRTMAQHEKMIALGQMAAGVTHEIANPLASMDSLLQLAQRRPERVNSAALLTLREQIQRITEIIRQMKAFAHPDGTERTLANPNEVVEAAMKIIQFDSRLRRAKIQTILAPEVGSIPCMPQALQQVLVNLVINALDATGEATDPLITVQTSRRHNVVQIEVSDNGTGIEPQHLRRLFEPFFTTKPVTKGTGLGLSISYSLLERQGGTLSVRSVVGQGATFIIKLPAPELSRVREAPPGGLAVSENAGA